MEPKITSALLISNIELIRDRIAEILLAEIHNQYALKAIDFDVNEVWLERITPVNNDEDLIVNVGILNLKPTDNIPTASRLDNSYFIDIYLVGQSEPTSEDGGYTSAKKVQKLAGLILNILHHTAYIRLGFDTEKIISRRAVTDITFSQDATKDEGGFMRMARIVLNVEANEYHGQLSAISVLEANTTIKLNQTEKGFYLSLINN